MHLLATTKHTIPCSIDTLFAFVTNMEHYGNWFPGVANIQALDASVANGVGKKYRESIQLGTQTVALTIAVVQFEPNISFVTEGDLSPLMPKMEMNFTETERDKTLFNLAYYSRNTALTDSDPLLQQVREDLQTKIRQAMSNLLLLAPELATERSI